MRILIIFLLILGCSGGGGGAPAGDPIPPQVAESGVRASGKCRHEALIASVIYEESGYQTRIIYGKIPDGEYHVQAQAFIGDSWEWLSVRSVVVYVSGQDYFVPSREYSSYEVYDNCVNGVWF